MALLFMDSFDDRLGTFSGVEGSERYDSASLSGGSGIVAGGRTANSLKLQLGLFLPTPQVGKTIPATGNTVVVGFAFLPAAIPGPETFVVIRDATFVTLAQLQINANATLSVLDGLGTVLCTSTQTVSASLWQYLELKVVIGSVSGSVSLRLNTVVIASATGVNTQHTAPLAVAGSVTLKGWDNTLGAWSADDFYICDGSGGDHNDFLGAVVIEYLAPTAAGTHTSFTPVGVGSNWDAVNDSPYNDDTDYVASSNPGDLDTYLHAALSGSPATILAVTLNLRARKEDVIFRTFTGVVRSGGTDYTEGTFPLHTAGTNWSSTYQAVMIHDPATGAAWTVTGVNNSEIGVQLTA